MLNVAFMSDQELTTGGDSAPISCVWVEVTFSSGRITAARSPGCSSAFRVDISQVRVRLVQRVLSCYV